MKKILSLLVYILCVALKSPAYADELLTVFGRSNNIASIKIGTSSYRYILYHQVDGYKFSCAKNRILVWGVIINKKFNESPDFNIERKISYIDLKYKKPKSVTSIGTGVLAADFFKNKKTALIQTPQDFLILSLKNGKYSYTDDTDGSFDIEKCTNVE